MLQPLYAAMLPVVRARAYYIWREKDAQIAYEKYALVLLTLGEGVDALQQVYQDRQCLTEAYMIECLALELLEKAYEEFVKQIQRESGQWAVKIDFLGDTYPLEWLPKLYSEFDTTEIVYNEKMVLSPSKSVAFLLPMSETEKKESSLCRICENCSNQSCMFRTEANRAERHGMELQKKAHNRNIHTYGYQSIFGSNSTK
jgi:hypothetical protein